MPIFEYACRASGHEFETPVRNAELPALRAEPPQPAPCGTCGHPGGPGSCAIDLGPAMAQALSAALRNAPPDRHPGAEFSPAENVTCMRETGLCRTAGIVDETLTAVLYGPRRRAER